MDNDSIVDHVMEQLANIKEIHIMPYSHHDYAWTNSREWHIRRYVQIFRELLDALHRHPRFTWMIDNVIHSLLPFLQHCPDQIEELKRRVAEGRIYVANGGYSLARSNYVGEETFIRNMVKGKRFFQQLFGLDDIDFFYNCDTGCGHSQLPQVLKLGGHTYYRFQRPGEAAECREIPRQFVWKGLDGSTVTVSRGTYGGFYMDGQYTNMDFEAHWQDVKREFVRLELTDKIGDLQVADIVWLNYGCDDCRPLRNLFDEPINITGFVEEWNRREPTKLLFSSPGPYFGKLSGMALPVHEGVIDQCELSFNAPIRGGRSMWRMRSELDRLLVKAESIAAFASMKGVEYPQAELETLWDQLFEITGHGIEWIYEEDYEELYTIALGVRSTAASLIKRLGAALAERLPAGQRSQYLFYNILNWQRTETVQLRITSPFGVTGFDLYDSNGAKLEYQIVNICNNEQRYADSEYNEIEVAVQLSVPGMGCLGVTPVGNGALLRERVKAEYIDVVARPAAPDIVVVNTGLLEVTFAAGRIRQIRDLSTGGVIRPDSPHGVADVRFVHTEASLDWVSSWDSIGEHGMSPQTCELVENGPLRWIYRVSGTIGNSEFKQNIVLKKGERAIGFDTDLICSADEGYFIADVYANPDTYLYADIPFGIEERHLEKEYYGKILGSKLNYNHLERGWPGQFYAKTWASFQCGELHAAIVSENCSIYYNQDTGKPAVSILLNRSMPLRTKTEGWLRRTHPSIEGSGAHNYRYHLYFPAGKERLSDIVRFSREKAQPLELSVQYRPRRAEGAEGASRSASFVNIEGGSVIVTAFYKQDDSYILRLYETEGKNSTIRVMPGFDVAEGTIVDFFGNACDSASLQVDPDRGCLTVAVNPWQIMTLQIKTRGV